MIRPFSEERRLKEEKEPWFIFIRPSYCRASAGTVLITRNRIDNSKQKKRAACWGLIHDIRIIKSKRGDTIAILISMTHAVSSHLYVSCTSKGNCYE